MIHKRPAGIIEKKPRMSATPSSEMATNTGSNGVPWNRANPLRPSVSMAAVAPFLIRTARTKNPTRHTIAATASRVRARSSASRDTPGVDHGRQERAYRPSDAHGVLASRRDHAVVADVCQGLARRTDTWRSPHRGGRHDPLVDARVGRSGGAATAADPRRD